MKELKGQAFKDMVQVGCERLHENAELVNSLNVFPVPDGDTGTNMNMSFTSGAQRVAQSQEEEEVGALAVDLAKGLLMGARGNSGVILSQLFRGFSKSVETYSSLTAEQFAQGFTHGVETAYKAVMKPVEGTILTVARESAKAGEEKAKTTDNIIDVMRAIVEGARVSLDNTPELLPVLKEVGVVDSGGQGLLFVYEGFLESLTGEKLPTSFGKGISANLASVAHHENFSNVAHAVDTKDIQFGYCTEIMVRIGEGETVTDTFDYDTFRNYLNDLGDSLLVVADDEIIKVHVHTERPGEVMNYGQKFGSLIKIKVDNMRLQHEDVLTNKATKQKPVEKAEYGIIAIAAGNGVQTLLKDMGATVIINGGQTMNPSTEDILKAIEEAHAEKVIILPNNKNIQMAADQAAQVSDTPAVVVPTKTIPQGMTALLAFNPLNQLEENKENMTNALSSVVSGQVTIAVRDTQIDGIDIKENDFMGLIDGKIVFSQKDKQEVTLDTLRQMISDDTEIVTILIGEDATQEEAEEIVSVLEQEFEDIEFDIQLGDQPVYHFLLASE
ncbi:DAK2 domain-containing protein [Carnobacteriaceae bacterium zg-ZUI78]|nr:DAK2 domain-containing protein [Carnobacteriaceae bacterium zg-ZUI78]